MKNLKYQKNIEAKPTRLYIKSAMLLKTAVMNKPYLKSISIVRENNHKLSDSMRNISIKEKITSLTQNRIRTLKNKQLQFSQIKLLNKKTGKNEKMGYRVSNLLPQIEILKRKL